MAAKKYGVGKTVKAAYKGLKQMKKRKVKTKAQKTKKKKPTSRLLGGGTARGAADQTKSYYRKVNKY